MLFSNRGEQSNSVSHSQGQGQKGQQWFLKPYTRKDSGVKLCIMPHVWHIPLTASAVSMLCWSETWWHEMMLSWSQVEKWEHDSLMSSSYHKGSCMLVGLLGYRASYLTVRNSETEHDCLPVWRHAQIFCSHVYRALQHLITPRFLLHSNNCILFLSHVWVACRGMYVKQCFVFTLELSY